MRWFLIVAVMTGLIAGCATTPEPVQTPHVQALERGESLHQVLEKHGTVGTAVASVVGVALFPVALVLAGFAEIIESQMESGAKSVPDPYADAPDELWTLENVPDPVESLVDWLGKPELRLLLAPGEIEVLAYNVDRTDAAVYVGISGEQALWFARHDSWLWERAKSHVGAEDPQP